VLPRLLLTLLSLSAPLSAARAAPLGPDCDTCQGAVFSLAYGGSPISTSATSETFEITLSVDTSGYDGGGTLLQSVAVKVSPSLIAAQIVGGPQVGSWTEELGGLDANGCSGNGGGFDCVGASTGDGVPVPAGIYVFVFQLEMATGSLLTGPDAASIKARFSDAAGEKVGALVSENITLVPEPGSALLLAGGLLVLAARRRGR
jgi:hypothetical protein